MDSSFFIRVSAVFVGYGAEVESVLRDIALTYFLYSSTVLHIMPPIERPEQLAAVLDIADWLLCLVAGLYYVPRILAGRAWGIDNVAEEAQFVCLLGTSHLAHFFTRKFRIDRSIVTLEVISTSVAAVCLACLDFNKKPHYIHHACVFFALLDWVRCALSYAATKGRKLPLNKLPLLFELLATVPAYAYVHVYKQYEGWQFFLYFVVVCLGSQPFAQNLLSPLEDEKREVKIPLFTFPQLNKNSFEAHLMDSEAVEEDTTLFPSAPELKQPVGGQQDLALE